MAAQHLGELGQAKQAPDVTFGWFGSTIRTNPDGSPELEFIEFMKRASMIDLGEVDPAQVTEDDLTRAAGAMDTILDFLKQQIHPQDWDQFWALAKTNRQTINDLFQVAKTLSEVAAGFPSGRPSASSAGRSRTKKKSPAGSRSRATRGGLTAIQGGLEAVNLPALRGRPDLQVAVVLAQEARNQGGRRASA